MNLGKPVVLAAHPGSVNKIISKIRNCLDVDLDMQFLLIEIIGGVNLML